MAVGLAFAVLGNVGRVNDVVVSQEISLFVPVRPWEKVWSSRVCVARGRGILGSRTLLM